MKEDSFRARLEFEVSGELDGESGGAGGVVFQKAAPPAPDHGEFLKLRLVEFDSSLTEV